LPLHASSLGSGTKRNADLPELLPAQLKETDAAMILDALLRHCLEGHQYQADELFHFCILKWMMQCGLPPYQYQSPYLKTFLEVHATDQPELLCRYLQHHGRWAEACDAYVSLAKSKSAKVDASELQQEVQGVKDRVVLLQSAALCARMPGSNRRVEPILRMMTEITSREEEQARI